MSSIKTELYPEAASRHGKKSEAYREAKRAISNEWVSGLTGVILALFMWGHMFFVSSILTGERGFNFVANLFEITWLAQPTIMFILLIFFVHFVSAGRKIPSKLYERNRIMELGLRIKGARKRWNQSTKFEIRLRNHSETSLWIWQVRTGMIILVIGSIHLFVVGVDIWQRTFGGSGITTVESMGRVQDGMWMLYAILLFCVELHAGIGLYRVTVKWGLGSRIPIIGKKITREMAHRAEQLVLWFFLIIGVITLLVLGGVLDPPLEFLLSE